MKKRRVVAKGKAVKGKAAKKKKATKSCGAPGPRRSTPITQPSPEEKAAYTRTLIESGEAARLDQEGKLPAGATHKIVEDAAGNVTVVRRRFSIT